jgi:rRNA-processing protein FCF1
MINLFKKKQKQIKITFVIPSEVITELKTKEEKHITDQMIADSIVAFVTAATIEQFNLLTL